MTASQPHEHRFCSFLQRWNWCRPLEAHSKRRTSGQDSRSAAREARTCARGRTRSNDDRFAALASSWTWRQYRRAGLARRPAREVANNGKERRDQHLVRGVDALLRGLRHGRLCPRQARRDEVRHLRSRWLRGRCDTRRGDAALAATRATPWTPRHVSRRRRNRVYGRKDAAVAATPRLSVRSRGRRDREAQCEDAAPAPTRARPRAPARARSLSATRRRLRRSRRRGGRSAPSVRAQCGAAAARGAGVAGGGAIARFSRSVASCAAQVSVLQCKRGCFEALSGLFVTSVAQLAQGSGTSDHTTARLGFKRVQVLSAALATCPALGACSVSPAHASRTRGDDP